MSSIKYADKDNEMRIRIIENPSREIIQKWENINKKHEKTQAADWDWTKINAGGITRTSKLIGQKPTVIGLEVDNKLVGMALVAYNFYTSDLKHLNKNDADYKLEIKKPSYIKHFSNDLLTQMNRRSAFLWYIQTAPPEYLKEINFPMKKKIEKNKETKEVPNIDISFGKILYNEIISNAKDKGLNSIILHADPAGGDGLLKVYQHGWHMDRVSQDSHISFGRRNDGRYFELKSDKFEEVRGKILNSLLPQSRMTIQAAKNVNMEKGIKP